MVRATKVVIDLNKLEQNILSLRARLAPGVGFLAVVKANAYGHGMEQIAHTAIRCGATMLGVAIPEEGVLLRKTGITTPILVLGPTGLEYAQTLAEYDLMPAVFQTEMLDALQDACQSLGKKAAFHFKIDSGMSRIGFTDLDAFQTALTHLADCPDLIFQGMFTHFAVSELPDKSFTHCQAERFGEFVTLAHTNGFHPIIHAANSGALLELPQYHFDMVRGGIAMYGYDPGARQGIDQGITPVLTWKTSIAFIKTIPAGSTVSYGRTFTAARDTRVATLPVGYGDGYFRSLSNKADVLIHGKRAKQIGTVCMDQIMVDVTDIPDALPGDEVVLLGSQGEERITADELASLAGTISYELLLSISSRVPREFHS